jgi:lambda family phage portal protein
MNILDAAIGFFAPKWGAQRTAWRLRMAMADREMARRSYDGAARGRRTDGWRATSASANTELAYAQPILRNRARDLERNNPSMAKAIEELVSAIVNSGIVPTPVSKSKRDKTNLAFAWKAWAKTCDFDEQLPIAGLQALAVRAMIVSGSVLIVRRWDTRVKPGKIALRIQVLENDHLDRMRSGPVTGGGLIMGGIEFDKDGRRVAYWIYPRHPGEVLYPSIATGSVRVPADDVIHLYRKIRPGQVDGASWLAPSMMRARDLDDYKDAMLLGQKIAACTVAMVKSPGGAAKTTLAQSSNDDQGRRVEQFEPGMIEYLFAGEDVEFHTPNPPQGHDVFVQTANRDIAAGLNVTYEGMTGDLSNTNYSSIRSGRLSLQAFVESIQWQTVIPIKLERLWGWFIGGAVLAGIVNNADADVEWTTPRMPLTDPERDYGALITAIRAGLISLPEALRQLGEDPDAVLDDIAASNAQLDQQGIILDSDPRHRTQQGLDVNQAAKSADKIAKDKTA